MIEQPLNHGPERAAGQRTAPLARATSDVTRYRGLWAASVLGTALLVFGLWASNGSGALVSPGELSNAHARAGLECQHCHRTEPPSEACTSCHAGQRSRREAHESLMRAGVLTCSTCHPGHQEPASLVFAPGEPPELWQGSRSSSLGAEPVAVLTHGRASMPLVRQASCAGCHDPARPTDPAGACFAAPNDEYQRCFDEHRAAAAAPSERDALWQASRQLLSSGAAVPSDRPEAWWLLVVSLGGAVLVFSGSRWWRRRRAGSPPAAAAVQAAERRRLPQIDTATCLGCYACVDACPFDVLEVRRFVAVVARPDACCGLSLCEQRCPNGSLVVREGEPVDNRPRLDLDLQSPDVPGLFLAGDLTGLSLIRNAINQGAHVAHAVADSCAAGRRSQSKASDALDLVVVGTGPAGLSATLEATRLGLSVEALEQGTLAESIKNFPRHKLVLDHGVAGDTRASLWVEQCEKEQLVAKWTQTARRERLHIREKHRVTSVARQASSDGPPLFVVRADTGAGELTVRARHVLLAMGKRGSPRLLGVPIPDAWLSHVHYALLDARPFAGRRVLVVGLGDTAMEAAVALAAQPDSEVTVVARGSGFSRGKTKNIQTLEHLARTGRVQLLFDARLTAFREDTVEVSVSGEPRRLQVSSVFVLIGAELPWGLLESAGIRRTAKSEDGGRESR